MIVSEPPRGYVYGGMTQSELDRAYDQRAWVADADAWIATFALRSAEARERTRHIPDIRYGEGSDETLDVFPAEGADAPIHVHIHGGAWRALSKSDVSFVAPAFVRAGVTVVVPDFTNLPGAGMPRMIDQLRRAIGFVHRAAARWGADPARLAVSGHSSGAHLASLLTTTDWTDFALPADVIKATACVSGVYDLEPVLLSARRQYVRLSAAEGRALSPLHYAAMARGRILVAYADGDSPEFRRQGAAFASALTAAGCDVDTRQEQASHHFTIALRMADGKSSLFAAIAGLMNVAT